MAAGSEGRGRAGPNPYVGPEALQTGQTLHGRDNEVDELYYLLCAERIVLFHAPSGAGKSSLVQAGLIPRLRTRFDVWKPTRVKHDPPPGVTANRYALSALQGFEEGIPADRRRPPEMLAKQDLAQYVKQMPRPDGVPKSVVLIFDQFEEVLTVEPRATDAKHSFFAQLGDLLRMPHVWALLVVREDYLAPLDPFARQVPTHLRNRYRIDLLGLRAAQRAIEGAATEGGRKFAPGVADRLVTDLATVQVQQPDESFRPEKGRSVEPVQLQVVCFQLWKAMPEDDLVVDDEDLARYGNVTEALSTYYARSVEAVAGKDLALTRKVREWCGQRLITPGRLRDQVRRGTETSEGLDNGLIEDLLDTHLIRAEQRGPATWYELAHDRLIEPILRDNEAWSARNLSEFERRAQLWNTSGEPAGLLFTGEALAAAESWTANRVLTRPERRFLEECRKAQSELDREREQAERDRIQSERDRQMARRLRRYLAGVSALLAITTVLLVMAIHYYRVAKDATQRALTEAGEKGVALAAQAMTLAQLEVANKVADEKRREAQHLATERAKDLKALESANRGLELANRETAAALGQVRESVSQTKQALLKESEARRNAETATAEKDTAKKLAERAAAAREKLENLATARALATGARLLRREEQLGAATRDVLKAYLLHVGNHDDSTDEPESDLLGALHQVLGRLTRRAVVAGGPVYAIAVTPGGELVTAAPGQGVVPLRIDAFDQPLHARYEPGAVVGPAPRRVRAAAMAMGTDGRLVVLTGDADGGVARASQGASEVAWEPRPVHRASVTAVALSRDGRWSASGAADGAIALGRMGERPGFLVEPPASAPMDAAVGALAFNDDASVLCAGTGHQLLCWSLDGTGAARVGGPGITKVEVPVRALAFSPERSATRLLAIGDAKGNVRLVDRTAGRLAWSAADVAWLKPGGTTEVRVNALAFEGDRLLAAGGADGSIRVWRLARRSEGPTVLRDHAGQVLALLFAPDGGSGRALYSGGADKVIRKWTTGIDDVARQVCRAAETGPPSFFQHEQTVSEVDQACAAVRGAPAHSGPAASLRPDTGR